MSKNIPFDYADKNERQEYKRKRSSHGMIRRMKDTKENNMRRKREEKLDKKVAELLMLWK